jgi:hypothetical protein
MLCKMPYSSDGKNSQQVLNDFEAGLLNDHGGNTTEYLHAVIMVRTAQEQRRWATVAAIAGRGGLQWPRRGGLQWPHFASVVVCS